MICFISLLRFGFILDQQRKNIQKRSLSPESKRKCSVSKVRKLDYVEISKKVNLN